MDRSEFDKFADEYNLLHSVNIQASGESPEYFARYKVRDLRAAWNRHSPQREPRNIIDFGAGVGTSVPHFARLFPESTLACVDVSLKSLRLGWELNRDRAGFVAFDGERLPFSDNSIDCLFAACVFHHIPDGLHIAILQELRRILHPVGLLLIYEHNPYNPLTKHAVNTCPFDENAVLIKGALFRSRLLEAGYRRCYLAYRVFFPRVLRLLRPIEPRLGWLPLGAQYALIAHK